MGQVATPGENEPQGQLCRQRTWLRARPQVRREGAEAAGGTGGRRAQVGEKWGGMGGGVAEARAGASWAESGFYSRSLGSLWTFQAGGCHDPISLLHLRSRWVLCGKGVGQDRKQSVRGIGDFMVQRQSLAHCRPSTCTVGPSGRENNAGWEERLLHLPAV